MKAQKGKQSYSSTLSLTSAQDGLGGQSQAPAALPPEKRAGTHCTGGRVGPRAGVDRWGKSSPPPGFDPRDIQPVASHCPTLIRRNTSEYVHLNPQCCKNPKPHKKSVTRMHS